MDNRILQSTVVFLAFAIMSVHMQGCSDVGFSKKKAELNLRQGSDPGVDPGQQPPIEVLLDPPEILIHPSSEGATFNELYVMMVYAQGDELSYQWFFDGAPLIGETSSFLRFEPLSLDDIGNYYVIVSNPVGEAVSLDAEILIAPPEILQNPVGANVDVGATHTFSVSVVSDDIPDFQWRHKGVAIPGATASTLTIANIQIAAAGAYDVVVSNASADVTSLPATLAVRDEVLVDVWQFLQNEMGYVEFCNVGEGYGAATDTEVLQGMGEHICDRLGYGADSYVRYFVGPKKSKRMCVFSPNRGAIVYADPSCTGCRGNIEDVLCSYILSD